MDITNNLHGVAFSQCEKDEALVVGKCCDCFDWPVVFPRARAIGYRQHNSEAVGGFFSQIGNLYMVHHLWGEARQMSSIAFLSFPPVSFIHTDLTFM
jgi:hypothetical protein